MQSRNQVSLARIKGSLLKLLPYKNNTITPIIEDICVYGNNFKSILVLVVVPNEEVVNKWAYANGHIASSPIFVRLTS